MKKRLISTLVKCVFSCIPCALFSGANAQDIVTNVSLHRIKNDVYFLASDSLFGRRFPTKGREQAAAYIASEFKSVGLLPFSTNDHPYFQKIPVKSTKRGITSIQVNGQWFPSCWKYSFAATKFFSDSVTLPIKFIGDMQHDMNFGVGDTILHITSKNLENAMQTIQKISESNQATYFAISLPKQKKFSKRIINQEGRSGTSHYPSGMFGIGAKESSWLYSYLPDSTYDLKTFLFSDELFLKLYGQKYSAVKKNMKRSQKSLSDKEKIIKSITLKTQFRVEEILQYDENVIGYIEGTDLKDEFIIICGHYDHVGMQPKGVCLGAEDNASGSAGVMELARMCSQAKDNGFEFRRSIVFIAFCAEESGLNGSNFYVDNPIFPLEKTVLVINMDMIGRSDTPPDMPGFGYFRPIKGEKRQVKKVLRTVDRQIDDLHVFFRQSFKEDLMWYMGSDHFPFVKKGVPALVVTTGSHDDYHTPTDTPDKINFENMVNILKSLFVLITEVSSEPETFPVKGK